VSLYLVLRYLHILAAVAFIGGVLSRQVVRALANRSSDVRTFATLSGAAGRIENVLVIPGNGLTILIGLLLAWLIEAPILGFITGNDQNWLLVSNVLLLVGMLTVPLFFVPRGKRFDAHLDEALARAEFTPELRAEMRDPAMHLVHTLEIVLLLVIAGLMVLKPF
jgi:uncharacterized membrane protein